MDKYRLYVLIPSSSIRLRAYKQELRRTVNTVRNSCSKYKIEVKFLVLYSGDIVKNIRNMNIEYTELSTTGDKRNYLMDKMNKLNEEDRSLDYKNYYTFLDDDDYISNSIGSLFHRHIMIEANLGFIGSVTYHDGRDGEALNILHKSSKNKFDCILGGFPCVGNVYSCVFDYRFDSTSYGEDFHFTSSAADKLIETEKGFYHANRYPRHYNEKLEVRDAHSLYWLENTYNALVHRYDVEVPGTIAEYKSCMKYILQNSTIKQLLYKDLKYVDKYNVVYAWCKDAKDLSSPQPEFILALFHYTDTLSTSMQSWLKTHCKEPLRNFSDRF